MRMLSGSEVCTILRKHGFEQVRQRGSHIIMQRKLADTTVTVPVPDHKELRIGTLMSIIRQSQLDRSAFE
ncbi:MAG: type II toxin-antitoxin system HicA family toxin [Flavobacteriales bacterium]